jgi:hypothetical protein
MGQLAAGEVVIVDGGMGSQLQAEGVPMDVLRGARAPTWRSPGRRRGGPRRHRRGRTGGDAPISQPVAGP